MPTTYEPPFTVTPRVLDLVVRISEEIGRQVGAVKRLECFVKLAAFGEDACGASDEMKAVHACLLLFDLARAEKLLPVRSVGRIEEPGGNGFIAGEIDEGRGGELLIAAGLCLPVLAEVTAFEGKRL